MYYYNLGVVYRMVTPKGYAHTIRVHPATLSGYAPTRRG